MGKFSLKEANPVLYEQVMQEQNELRGTYASRVTMARLCPYCNHKLEVLCRGSHGSSSIKCPNCNEEVFFPPVSFRRAKPSSAYYRTSNRKVNIQQNRSAR